MAMNQIGILMNQIEAFGRSRLTLCFEICEHLTVCNGDGARFLRPTGKFSKNNICRGQYGLPWHWL